MANDRARVFVTEWQRGGAAALVLVGESAGAAEGGEVDGALVGGRGFAEDEKLDETEDKEGDRELAEEEALGEGETGCN